jgi:hypothetical protein
MNPWALAWKLGKGFLGDYWKPILIGIAVLATVWLVKSAITGYGDRREAHGRAEVQALWDADKAARQKAFDEATAKTQAIIEADRRTAQETESGLLKQIEDARAAGTDLGQRMSNYQRALARCRALPATAGPTASPDGAAAQPPNSSEIERVVEEIRTTNELHFANCAADATELAGWQVFYPKLQANRAVP